MTDEKTLQSGSSVVADDLGMITDRASAELSAMAGDSLLLVGGGGFLGYYLVQAVLAWNAENRSQRIALAVYDNGEQDWCMVAFKMKAALKECTP